MLPGDHFFLKTSEQRLMQMLSEELRRIALWAAPS
jgi:surfactin synthase thioesterase subunit